jgi:DNA-directed RNA polymerase specialized sigma subunit
MKTKKRTKTKDALLLVSKEDMDDIGLTVKNLMEDEMSFLVNKYIYKYKNATASTFGWTEDDLRQHIMIILWKGVVTYNPDKNVKLTTYLSTILYYQMGNLSKSCQNKKNSMSKLYCPDDLYDSEEITIFENAEDWSIYSQQFKILMDKMTKGEMKVLVHHLLKDQSISKMQKSLKMNRVDIISNLKSLKSKMEYYLGDQNG